MNVYQKLKDADLDLSNWCSDLYVPVSIKSTEIIDDYLYKQNVTTFRCKINNIMMYEIPFAYPHHRTKLLRN